MSKEHVQNVLKAVEATIEKSASQSQRSYTIAGRTLESRSIEELLVLRDKYKAELKTLTQEEDLAKGIYRSPRRQIHTRFYK